MAVSVQLWFAKITTPHCCGLQRMKRAGDAWDAGAPRAESARSQAARKLDRPAPGFLPVLPTPLGHRADPCEQALVPRVRIPVEPEGSAAARALSFDPGVNHGCKRTSFDRDSARSDVPDVGTRGDRPAAPLR